MLLFITNSFNNSKSINNSVLSDSISWNHYQYIFYIYWEHFQRYVHFINLYTF